MKIGLFVDKGTKLMRLSMKWGGFVDGRGIWEGLSMKRGGFMEREQGAKERRREEGGDWQAKCCAGRKGEGCGFEGKRFL